MRFIYLIFPLLLSPFFNRVDLIDLWPLMVPIKVYEVQDGDSIRFRLFKHFESLRIARIDAPELKQFSLYGQVPIGADAKRCLKKMLNQKDMRVELAQRDMYGRWLGDIWIKKKRASYLLLQQGCVSLYPWTRFDSWMEKNHWVRILEAAKLKRKGLWKEGGMQRPYHYRRAQRKNKKLKS